MSAALLAVQNADVLRALWRPSELEADPEISIAGLARELGRDDSNLGKSLAKLRAEGLVESDSLALTADGDEMRRRLEVLTGDNILPPGFSALLHRELASHPLNPRKSFDEDALEELRQDILQSGGLTSSLLVRPAPLSERDEDGMPNFWIVAGERRWRAIAMAIQDGDLPADYRLPCQVREMSDAEHLRLSIGENIQRVDLDHVELGRQFEALILTGEDTPQSIAERISKTPEYVQQHVRILRLGDDELDQVKLGEMTFKQALALVAKPRPKAEPAPAFDFAEEGSERNHPTAELVHSLHAYSSATISSGRNGVEDKPPSTHAAGSGHDPQGASPAAGNVAEPQHSPVRPAAREAPPAGDLPSTFEPSAKMRLILMEVADKVAKDPMARFREGYTAVAEVPAGGSAPELVRARAIGFRSIGGKDEVRIDPRGPGKSWLDGIGWGREDALGRQWRIGDAAIDCGIGRERAAPAYAGRSYMSEWLNLQAEAGADEPASPGQSEPRTSPTLPDGAMLGDSLIGIDDEDVDLQACRKLAQDWTGTSYRFPPTSPSLPKEEDFRGLLDRLGVRLPLRASDVSGEQGTLYDADGRAIITADYSGDHLSEDGAKALAELVRIAVHVCSGEGAQKVAS